MCCAAYLSRFVPLRFVHILNPFHPPEGSDLVLAQAVTFESMRRAKAACDESVSVQLLSAQFPEDHDAVPEDFIKTPDLDRSILELGSFGQQLKLPVLSDILDRAYAFEEADYIIFTNVDIAVQPHFYKEVALIAASGHDAFIINRRRIIDAFEGVHELDEMYALKGKPHPGFDCFVFKRELYPKFSLDTICVGVPFIGIGLAQNLFCFAEIPKVFTGEVLTFHMGIELFRKRAPKGYKAFNKKAFYRAMKEIWPHLNTKKWPHGKRWFIPRYWNWGINPSLPVPLALRLEMRRWFRKSSVDK